MGKIKNSLKPPEHITSVVYPHVILFRKHYRDKIIEKEINIVLLVLLY